VGLIAAGYLGYRELDRQTQGMMESKYVWTSPATVVRKSEGHVYYEIDNLDILREPRRTLCWEPEAKRLRAQGPRVAHSVDWYDRIQVGSTIFVHYQCLGTGNLIIVGADLNRY
jgi:hypothetical protein